MQITIEVNEDLSQIIQRRQRLMDSLDTSRGLVVLSLIEAENQKLARVLVEAYRKQVEWKV